MSNLIQSTIILYVIFLGIMTVKHLVSPKGKFWLLLVQSLLVGILLNLASIFLTLFIFALGVITSHLVFNTPMEWFYYIYIIAAYQFVFYGVSVMVLFLMADSDLAKTTKRKMLFQVFLVILISTPMVASIFAYTQISQAEEELSNRKYDEQWIALEFERYSKDYRIESKQESGDVRTYVVAVKGMSEKVEVVIKSEFGITNGEEIEEKLMNVQN